MDSLNSSTVIPEFNRKIKKTKKMECKSENIWMQVNELKTMAESKNKYHSFRDIDYILSLVNESDDSNPNLIATLLRKFLSRAYYDSLNGLGNINVKVNQICHFLESEGAIKSIFDSEQLEKVLAELIVLFSQTYGKESSADIEKAYRIVKNRNYIYYPSILKVVRHVTYLLPRETKNELIFCKLDLLFDILTNPNHSSR